MAIRLDLRGTVRTFDTDVRAGSVLLDDGRTLRFDTAAFDLGGLRLLRPGQRVRLRVEDEDGRLRVTGITLATFRFADEP